MGEWMDVRWTENQIHKELEKKGGREQLWRKNEKRNKYRIDERKTEDSCP